MCHTLGESENERTHDFSPSRRKEAEARRKQEEKETRDEGPRKRKYQDPPNASTEKQLLLSWKNPLKTAPWLLLQLFAQS